MAYVVGMKVEVCHRKDGLEEAWYHGTITEISPNTDSPTYQVQLCHCLSHMSNPQPLIENIPRDSIRPTPPIAIFPSYIPLGYSVEAHDDNYWKRGIIIDSFVSPLSQQEFYEVHFPISSTLKGYSRSTLRPSQVWTNDEWRTEFEE